MKPKEVAEYLSVHPNHVYRLLYAHNPPGVKLKGNGWRIDRKKLESWIETKYRVDKKYQPYHIV